jgi:hypothetical protein
MHHEVAHLAAVRQAIDDAGHLRRHQRVQPLVHRAAVLVQHQRFHALPGARERAGRWWGRGGGGGEERCTKATARPHPAAAHRQEYAPCTAPAGSGRRRGRRARRPQTQPAWATPHPAATRQACRRRCRKASPRTHLRSRRRSGRLRSMFGAVNRCVGAVARTPTRRTGSYDAPNPTSRTAARGNARRKATHAHARLSGLMVSFLAGRAMANTVDGQPDRQPRAVNRWTHEARAAAVGGGGGRGGREGRDSARTCCWRLAWALMLVADGLCGGYGACGPGVQPGREKSAISRSRPDGYSFGQQLQCLRIGAANAADQPGRGARFVVRSSASQRVRAGPGVWRQGVRTGSPYTLPVRGPCLGPVLTLTSGSLPGEVQQRCLSGPAARRK